MNPSTEPRSSEAGFSLIEGLIAAALLLVVTIGILPLFSRSMLNNVKGNDSTRQSFGAVDGFEERIALPFNSFDNTVPANQTQVLVTDFIALQNSPSSTGGPWIPDLAWQPAVAVGDQQQYQRNRLLQQYSYDDFKDNQVFDTPLDGATEPRLVHLKMVQAQIQSSSSPGQSYTVQFVQGF